MKFIGNLSRKRLAIICIAVMMVFSFAPVSQALNPSDFQLSDDVALAILSPSSLTATVISSTQIDLNWKDNSTSELGYYIERKAEDETAFHNLDYVDPNITSYSDINLESHKTYTYRVRGLLDSGSTNYTNEVSATTKAVISIPSFLKAPTDLSAAAVSGQKQINLTWTDNTTHESFYSIERKTGSGSYAVIAQVPADSKKYADTTVSYNTTYTYQVQALGNGGSVKNSAYSNEASATTDKLSIIPFPDLPIVPLLSTTMKFYIGSTDYYVNGKLQTMDAAPVNMQGRTVLPIKYVASPIGAVVNWNDAERKVTISLNSKIIELWINSNIARINGQEVLIDPNNPTVTPVILPPGRTMLPLRFIAESLGSSVEWSQSTQEAKVTYPK